MDDPRRSNARDAELSALPPCPRCAAANAPKQGDYPAVIYIEQVNAEYYCRTCGKSWSVDA